jgi:hypothetical protein
VHSSAISLFRLPESFVESSPSSLDQVTPLGWVSSPSSSAGRAERAERAAREAASPQKPAPLGITKEKGKLPTSINQISIASSSLDS